MNAGCKIPEGSRDKVRGVRHDSTAGQVKVTMPKLDRSGRKMAHGFNNHNGVKA